MIVGSLVGVKVGIAVGVTVGKYDGVLVGKIDGALVGDGVGRLVQTFPGVAGDDVVQGEVVEVQLQY